MLKPDLSPEQEKQVNKFIKEAFHYNMTHNLFVRESEETIYNKDIKDCWPLIDLSLIHISEPTRPY